MGKDTTGNMEENTVEWTQSTGNIGLVEESNEQVTDASMGKELTLSADQDEPMSEESGKTLEIQLLDDVVEVITECQTRTIILFFLQGVPSESNFYKWGRLNWESCGWEIEAIRGLGKGYVSYMFKSVDHAQSMLQFGTWVICG